MKTIAAKKADIVETFKLDARRNTDDSLECVTKFPAEVTRDSKATECCSAAFCKLYGMSSKTKSNYWKIVTTGSQLEQEEASELKCGKNEGRRQQTLLWMKETFHLLCDILPTSDYSKKNYHLPKCLTKRALHQEYWEEMKSKHDLCGEGDRSEFKPYMYSTFCKLWLSVYDYIQIPQHTAFSVCAHCANLHDRLITASKQRDKKLQKEIGDLRKLHLSFIAGERLTYRDHQRLARDYPDSYLCLTVDGMDQAKLRGPHFAGGAIPKG